LLLTKYYSGDKSRVMRWVGHVARIEETEMHTGFVVGDLKERSQLECLDGDERIILKYIKW
jgi:hypothetical protein